MNRTKIEWVRNPDGSPGYTFNPITGCLNGCEYCYARKLANTRLRKVYTRGSCELAPMLKGHLAKCGSYPHADPFYPRFWEDRLHQVTLDQKPRGIFTCDMSDLFGIGIPESWTKRVFMRMKRCPQHRFYLLTKQPQNLAKFSPFPDNCWVGVSATDYDMAFRGTDILRQLDAKTTFMSFEPLLSPILKSESDKKYMLHNLDWVIIGSQTKPYKPPKIEWVREIIQACRKANVPIFLKNNLLPIIQDRKLIQEMPK